MPNSMSVTTSESLSASSSLERQPTPPPPPPQHQPPPPPGDTNDIMCNGHRFVKSSLFQSPGYLADLSPYIHAVLSSIYVATPLQLSATAIKPFAPIAQSILPARATNYLLSGTLTCEYCLHQVNQNSFDDARICPSLLLERLGFTDDVSFIMADQVLEAQEKRRVEVIKKWQQENERDREVKESGNSNQTSHEDSLSKSSLDTSNRETSDPETLGSRGDLLQEPASQLRIIQQLETKSRQYLPSHPDEANMYKDDLLIMRICPEIGLHSQAFKCVDCNKDIGLSTSRLCHYDGRYYCFQCHSGSDVSPIPARVIRNWDFTAKSVSKLSLQKIYYLRTKPVLFNIFQMNSILYGFIDRLSEIKHLLEQIHQMVRYLDVCVRPDKPQLSSIPKHLLKQELVYLFTLDDLFDLEKFYQYLSQLHSSLELHIVRKCESCRGKGFYCEICRDSRDILYPFSKNSTTCSKCLAVYHKNCFHRKKRNCPRCLRISSKKAVESSSASETDDQTLLVNK